MGCLPPPRRRLDDAGPRQRDVLPPGRRDQLGADREALRRGSTTDDGGRPAREVVDVAARVANPRGRASPAANRRLRHRRTKGELDILDPPQPPTTHPPPP